MSVEACNPFAPNAEHLKYPSTISEHIAAEMVDEIIENAFQRANKPKIPVGDVAAPNDPELLHREIKQLIEDMNRDNKHHKIITSGVGDQLDEDMGKESAPPTSTCSSRRHTLERKLRITNLVQNSKSMLNKLMKTEANETLTGTEPAEEKGERFMKSFDLSGEALQAEASIEIYDLTDADLKEMKEKRKRKKRFGWRAKLLRLFRSSRDPKKN